ncbi:conserved hypothetical protein [Paraburkholderia ribeironis]|uniref:TonB C-terminal domain-containing protein n=1 Tax=Paraburkholderia ribeironis TaxID=1247936 RepID=A0A1N7S9U3_9BURK|nr:conserved hypothetical protein [Paraburkholderia ribeironis]
MPQSCVLCYFPLKIMALIDKLLGNAIGSSSGPRKAIVRVLLDDAGRVQDVVLKRSCGNVDGDARALAEIRQMKFPRGHLGQGSRTSRRWHELAYAID